MRLGKAGKKRKKEDLEEYGKHFELFYSRKPEQLSKMKQLPKQIKNTHCTLSKAITHMNTFFSWPMDSMRDLNPKYSGY